MHVKLKPISHPELGEILIEDPIFPIGRDEAPFVNYDHAIVANLSRRHARIFEEAGSLYLADVGSRNGTRLNGKAVAQNPVRVRQGDEVAFAGPLKYEVEFQDVDGAELSQAATSFQLVLSPIGDKPKLDAITVNCFPFLVGKSGVAFASSVRQGLENNEFLSRRHAHFFVRGDSLFIEDLGSTNGTFVNGKRLSEHARSLESGDEIVFGANELSYIANWQLAGEGSEVPLVKQNNQAEHTIFVSSANSFLDIFCGDDEQGSVDGPDESVSENDALKPDERAKKRVRKSALRRFFIFVAELRNVIKEQGEPNVGFNWLTWGGGALVVVAIVISLYLPGSSKQEIQTLFDQQKYRSSAEMATEYLRQNPSDDDVQKLATRALLSYLMPLWRSALKQERFSDALAQIMAARPLVISDSAQEQLLDLLQWISQLHQYIAERGGVDAPLQLYQHEAIIESLLAWWQNAEQGHRNDLGLVLQHDITFSDINRRTFSYLRALSNEKSVYLPAIAQLNQTTQSKLNAGPAGALKAIYTDFLQQYPRVAGFDALQDDLKNYLLMARLLENSASANKASTAINISSADEVEKIKQAFGNRTFMTPPFKAKVEQLRAQYLPSRALTQSLENASKAWREGELAQTISILEKLNSHDSGVLLGRQLAHKRQLVSAYDALMAAQGSENYDRLLIDFHSRLNAEDDVFLLQAIQEDYKRLGDNTLKSAEQAWLSAQRQWDAYLVQGGILGAQRLEAKLSAHFREKAYLLIDANVQAHQAQKLSARLKHKVSAARHALHQKVVAEAELQRRSLKQLSMVLSPNLLAAKLNLLADRHSVEEVSRNE